MQDAAHVPSHPALTRRKMLARLGTALPLGAWLAGCRSIPPVARFAAADEAFLDELGRRSLLYFLENADPVTGLVKDRSRADEADARPVASIAATGFGLTALCIGAERRYADPSSLRRQAAVTLRFLDSGLPHEHGFHHHFVHAATGERAWKCEVSSIDTAILLCGVLTCGEYFDDPEIHRLARRLYERVDWPWLLTPEGLLGHGWKPETGFLKARCEAYCEHMMLYLLAIGSPTHPIPPSSWQAWRRPWFEYEGWRYVNIEAPLFIHQYSHAWFDFRGARDRHADYFENSVIATRAHRQFCLGLRGRFPHFGEDSWGVTASDSARGYVAWGGPPEHGGLDGTLVPCAAAGSLPFLPKECLHTLKTMREQFGPRVWQRYGFIDAFNPGTGWHAPDVIGIDIGITLLMAENARSGFVWRTFMRNDSAQRAMTLAGFSPASPGAAHDSG